MEWVILILISALFGSGKNITLKSILEKGNTKIILFWMTFLSGIGMLVFYNDLHFDYSSKYYLLMLVKSALITAAWYCAYRAYEMLDISVAAPLMNLSPIFLIFISMIILGETLSILQLVGVLTLILSTYMLELHSFHNLLEPLKLIKSKAFMLILFSLIAVSFSAVIDKLVLREANYQSTMFIFYMMMAIMYFCLIIAKKKVMHIKNVFIKLPYPIIAIALFEVIMDIAYFKAVALPGTMISLIIPLKRTSNLLTTLLGGKRFHEKHLLHRGFVCIVMILGVWMILS